jgi:hypothetical protein
MKRAPTVPLPVSPKKLRRMSRKSLTGRMLDVHIDAVLASRVSEARQF